MLKKRVLKRLLPLLFSFCFVFSGFLSVNAFAATLPIDSFSFYLGNQMGLSFFDNSGRLYLGYGNYYDTSYESHFNVGNFYNATQIVYHDVDGNGDFVYPFNFDSFDYYVAWDLYTTSYSSDYFIPSNLYVHRYVSDIYSDDYEISNPSINLIAGGLNRGFSVIGKLPSDINNYSITGFYVKGSGPVGGYVVTSVFIYQVPKNSSTEEVQAIITAINNQTTTLDGSIGEAADDIQQSIEDQYSGDPETEFSVEDVITQHNEKMGVLSFGSDVMLQFLDMFQSANVGTAELTLPGFNITVENVEYSVWPDYSFNFEQLNEWVPALMSVIRVMLPAFVWLMVLRYCIKVFEDNFLAK